MSSLITSTHVRSGCSPNAGGDLLFCGAVTGDGGLRLAAASGNQGRDAGRHRGSLFSLLPPPSPVASREATFRTFYFTPPRKPSGLEKRGRRLACLPTFSSTAPGRGCLREPTWSPPGCPVTPYPWGFQGRERDGEQAGGSADSLGLLSGAMRWESGNGTSTRCCPAPLGGTNTDLSGDSRPRNSSQSHFCIGEETDHFQRWDVLFLGCGFHIPNLIPIERKTKEEQNNQKGDLQFLKGNINSGSNQYSWFVAILDLLP